MTHHKHAPTLKDELAAKKLMAPPVTTHPTPFPAPDPNPQPLGCVAPIDSPQAEPCADLTQDQRKLTEAELRARLRQEKAEAKKVDLDELVEKVAGEDRRDPYKELAKNPSSLVSATAILVIG